MYTSVIVELELSFVFLSFDAIYVLFIVFQIIMLTNVMLFQNKIYTVNKIRDLPFTDAQTSKSVHFSLNVLHYSSLSVLPFKKTLYI
jgi:hypothetical protein